MRSGATDMPMHLEFDYRPSRAIKERLKRQCATPFAYFTAPKSFYPHTFTSTNYKYLPKLGPPKSRALSSRQVNEMRNWRAMYGQSVPQKTVRNMTTKDNPGTLPINLYAANSPPVEPLDFSALSQAPAVGTPQTNSRPETLYEQENAEKSVEIINILCVITDCHLKNGTLELEKGDLILLLEQLQTTNELIIVTEAADLSAKEANADSEQPRTRSSRGRKRRFEDDFYYYE
eukprot:gene14810-16350_t